MSLLNDINAINKYLKDTFENFGGQSVEYANALQSVHENISENVLDEIATKGNQYYQDKPTEPLQLSKGEKSQNLLKDFSGDVTNIRNFQKANPQNKMKDKYKKSLEARGEDVTPDAIKQEAENNYNFHEHSNDWYETAMNSKYLSDEEKEEVRQIYSEVNAKYDDPEWRAENIDGRLKELLTKHEMESLNDIEPPNIPRDGLSINPKELI